VNLDEILYGGNDSEDDLDRILLNTVASTIPKCRTLNYWGGCNFWSHWWIWMKFCMKAITLRWPRCHILYPVPSTIQNGGLLNRACGTLSDGHQQRRYAGPDHLHLTQCV